MVPDGVHEALLEFGARIEREEFPWTQTGGLIHYPEAVALVTKGNGSERQGKEGSATGSRQGPAGRKGSAHRSRAAAGTVPAGIGAVGERVYRQQLDAVQTAYPGTKVFVRPAEIWLDVPSQLFAGLDRQARFILVLPFDVDAWPEGWGFWARHGKHTPIGPRHTNFPTASICAFDRNGNGWQRGGDVVALLDLYTQWAARHLFNEVFGFWPGPHVYCHPFEALTEFGFNDHCGCSDPRGRYSECCRPEHHKMHLPLVRADFEIKFGRLDRRLVPPLIRQFVDGSIPEPPSLRNRV